MKLKYTLPIVFVFLAIVSVPASSEVASSNKTIAVCRIEYTRLGKRANWRRNYMYAVATNSEGVVEKVVNVRDVNHPDAFVREDKIIDCLKTWKLSPPGKYVVMISIGTHGSENFFQIVDPNHDVIRLVLP